jgi:hypothetical protein
MKPQARRFRRLYTFPMFITMMNRGLPMLSLTLIVCLVITGLIMNADRIDALGWVSGVASLLMCATALIALHVGFKSMNRNE